MITKAIILERIINSNTYAVRVPYLESAGIRTGKIIATLSDNPAISEEYRVGDVVYVGFEEHQAEKVVILGKLSLNENEPRGHANLESLDVQNSARLPKNTTIGDVDYSEILSAFRKFDSKQDTLIPGNNITIENNVISASGGGGGEPDNYLVSASVSGNNLTLTPNTGNPIVYSPASVNWGDIQGTLSNQTDLQNILNKKMSIHTFSNEDVAGVEGEVYTLTSDFRDIVIAMDTKIDIPRGPFFSELDLECYPVEIVHMDGFDYYLYLATVYTYFYAFRFKDENGVLTISTRDLIPIAVSPQYYADENQLELGDTDVGYNTSIYGKYLNNTPIFGPDSNYKFDSDYYNLAKDLINRTYSVLSSATEYTPDFVEFNKELYAKVYNLGSNNYYYSKIAMSNYYHEPRFNSGLSIASSSNVSEIHVPYATSSTYGVIKDLYSNYVPYSGATKAVDLGNKKLTTGMLHATGFVDFDKAINLGLSSSSTHILFYTGDGSNQHYTTLGPNSTTSSNASVILPSQSGVLALQSDLYNYILLSGTTSLYGNIIPSVNNAMLGNRSNPFFAIYADEVNTSNVYIGDTNDGANLYWDGEYTTFGIGTAGYFEINNTSKYGRSGIALTTVGQFTYNGNEVATVNQINDATLTIQLNSSTIGTFTANASNSSVINMNLSEYATSSSIAENYVPYSGASKDVNLGTNSFYAEDIYGNNIGLLLAGTNFQGFNFYDGDVNLLTGGGPLYIDTSGGGAYYDGEEIATQNWVSTNSFASFHASSLYASTIIISNRTLSGVYTKAEALAILNGTSSVS